MLIVIAVIVMVVVVVLLLHLRYRCWRYAAFLLRETQISLGTGKCGRRGWSSFSVSVEREEGDAIIFLP